MHLTSMKAAACHTTCAIRSRRSLFALALAICAFSFPFWEARAELVDHIVAAVNNEVITSSELAQTIALNRQLGSAGKGDQPALVTETLNGLITRQLLVQEARRLRFVEISEQEISAEVDKVKARFPSEAAFMDFLKAQDMTEQELARMLGERLLVARFVEKKVGLFVRVSRDDAQSYFDAHPAQFRGKRFQEVQKEITAALTDEKIGQQLDQYVAELRSKADIRINPL